MPSTITFNFGDVILVPFPFTDQSTSKKRPAVVVSSASYNQSRPDVMVMAITSQFSSRARFGEILVSHWQRAGLIKRSTIKPIITTIEKTVVIRKLGSLSSNDLGTLQKVLTTLFG